MTRQLLKRNFVISEDEKIFQIPSQIITVETMDVDLFLQVTTP